MDQAHWIKSSYSMSNGNCVEVAWVKASASESGNCVEVAGHADGSVAVRDSKDEGHGPVLRFTPAEWAAFVGGAKAGEFDDLTSPAANSN